MIIKVGIVPIKNIKVRTYGGIGMEEDIKILKEFTESSCCLASQEEIIECVKNLIKGYRELEKEIEILRE